MGHVGRLATLGDMFASSVPLTKPPKMVTATVWPLWHSPGLLPRSWGAAGMKVEFASGAAG